MDSQSIIGIFLASLASLAEIRSGSLLDRAGDGARYVQVGGIKRTGLETEEFIPGRIPERTAGEAVLKPGDVVIGLRGSANWAAAVPVDIASGQPLFATLDVGVIRPEPALLPDYVAWHLNLPSSQRTLASHRSGNTAPRLPLSALKQFDIPVPSLQRQAQLITLAQLIDEEQSLISTMTGLREQLHTELLRRAANKE